MWSVRKSVPKKDTKRAFMHTKEDCRSTPPPPAESAAASVALILRVVRVHVVVALPLARAPSLPPPAPPTAPAAPALAPVCRFGLVALQRPGGVGRGYGRAGEEPLLLLELALLRALPLCRRVLLLQVVLEALIVRSMMSKRVSREERCAEERRRDGRGRGRGGAPRPRSPCWRSHPGSRPRAGRSAGTARTLVSSLFSS